MKGNKQIRFDQGYRKGKRHIGLDNRIEYKYNKEDGGIDIEINKRK